MFLCIRWGSAAPPSESLPGYRANSVLFHWTRRHCNFSAQEAVCLERSFSD